MYIDTQGMHTHRLQWTTCEWVFFSPGSQRLRSSDLRTSTLTPEPSEPPPWLLTLKSYVTGEPFTTQRGHTTLHSHWLHFREGCIAFFRPRQRALLQKLCHEMQERHWALQRSIPWKPDRMCLNKGDARPSPAISILPSPSSRVTKVPVWPWWVMDVPLTDGAGRREITITCPVSWKSPSCFSIFYNNHFFFFFFSKHEIKNVWERETHQLIFTAKNMPSQPKARDRH